MPVSRMRMRPWLEQMIESNTISGLVWVDKRQKIFSIPWKHAARHGWELDKDACLFKEWAIHTGKYVEGQTSADPKTWKANFRCAMNSLPDIEEVKTKSINKGHQAMRVYRMLPVSPKCKRTKGKDTKRRNKSASVKSEDMDYSDAQSQSPVNHCSQLNDNTSSTQENTVDSTEHQEVTYVNQNEVPDWIASVEIGPDSTNEHFLRFEVSPEHSPAYDSVDEDIIKICQQMELDSNWIHRSSDALGFLSNELYTGSYSYSSPGSQWSDTSDEVDELPMYTVLGGLQSSIDSVLCQQIPCLL